MHINRRGFLWALVAGSLARKVLPFVPPPTSTIAHLVTAPNIAMAMPSANTAHLAGLLKRTYGRERYFEPFMHEGSSFLAAIEPPRRRSRLPRR